MSDFSFESNARPANESSDGGEEFSFEKHARPVEQFKPPKLDIYHEPSPYMAALQNIASGASAGMMKPLYHLKKQSMLGLQGKVGESYAQDAAEYDKKMADINSGQPGWASKAEEVAGSVAPFALAGKFAPVVAAIQGAAGSNNLESAAKNALVNAGLVYGGGKVLSGVGSYIRGLLAPSANKLEGKALKAARDAMYADSEAAASDTVTPKYEPYGTPKSSPEGSVDVLEPHPQAGKVSRSTPDQTVAGKGQAVEPEPTVVRANAHGEIAGSEPEYIPKKQVGGFVPGKKIELGKSRLSQDIADYADMILSKLPQSKSETMSEYLNIGNYMPKSKGIGETVGGMVKESVSGAYSGAKDALMSKASAIAPSIIGAMTHSPSKIAAALATQGAVGAIKGAVSSGLKSLSNSIAPQEQAALLRSVYQTVLNKNVQGGMIGAAATSMHDDKRQP